MAALKPRNQSEQCNYKDVRFPERDPLRNVRIIIALFLKEERASEKSGTRKEQRDTVRKEGAAWVWRSNGGFP